MSAPASTLASTIDEPWVGPTTGQTRYASLDIVRGVAVFGILLMNIHGFGGSMGPELFRDNGDAGANWWAWMVMATVFEGTQRTLFSLLFGAGVIILTERAERSGAGIGVADIYYRRNLWLIAFGMLNSYVLLWSGDILYFYGLVALFLFPFRKLSPRALILTGLAAMSVSVGLDVLDGREVQTQHAAFMEAQAAQEAGGELSKEQEDALEAWPKAVKDYKFDPEHYEKRLEAYRGSYTDIFVFNLPELKNAHGNITYRFLFLDAFMIMTIGMALMKLGVLTLERSTRFYVLMMLGGYAIGLPINAWEVFQYASNNFSFLADSHTWWSYHLGRLFTALGHLGLLLLFVRSGILAGFQERLAAVGRMALTNYLMHSVIAAFLFYGFGLGLYGHLDPRELYVVVGFICLFQLLISKPWLDRYRFGPAEWLWRSLTYMKTQPMRRDRSGTAAA